ncbi:MAG: hypothetical protein ABW019_17250 [Chitinophagaceae bacterium]
MEAEAIITQKEWQQLSPEERTFLAPLAADEQEYHLLKKMLLVAADDAAATPAPDPAIAHRLQGMLAHRPQRRLPRRWLYAAAAIALFALGAWLWQTRPGTIDNGDLAGASGDQRWAHLPAGPKPPIRVPDAPDNKITKTIVRVQQPAPAPARPSLPDPVRPDIPSTQQQLLAMHVSVRENAALLNLVTEVYE